MKIKRNIFDNEQRGGMMVELLLALALAAVMMPFIVNSQKERVVRAENISIAKEMKSVNDALERYIDIHKKELLGPVGKNITRVKISELQEFGTPISVIEKYGEDFQVRVLKSRDREGHTTLQGVVVLASKDISPMRTRQIMNLGDDKMGFVEGGKAFGTLGSWHVNAVDFGISGLNGIVETTGTTMGTAPYLWRVPSENVSDATMLSPLNLAGHDIVNSKFVDTLTAQFEEIFKSQKIILDRLVFQSKTTLDKNFTATEAVVSGTLSSDSRGLEVQGVFNLSNAARVSSFIADDLWVMNLNLYGLSVSPQSSGPGVLKVNQSLDMVAGRISAMYATVGFTGSITSKLVVKHRIEDSVDSDFYWDIATSTARFADMSFTELNRMVASAVRKESSAKTISGQVFSTVVTNKNATASDFMNAITEIQSRVRAKYHQLNLE